MTIEVGNKAPEFSGPTDSNQILSLNDFLGKNIVLFFYPKDMTPGCTNEACDFRDYYKEFLNFNTEIVGISKDSIRRHKAFKKKLKLPYPLVSDESNSICDAYGVWQEKKNYGKKYMGIVRSTFLINEKGQITAIWRNLRVKGHVDRVLEQVKLL